MYRLIEQIRQQGRLVRKPFVRVIADHEICRMMLRDDRLGFGNPLNTGLPQPQQALFNRTDLRLPNPVEPAFDVANGSA